MPRLYKFNARIAALLKVTDVAGGQEHTVIYLSPSNHIVSKGRSEIPLRGFPLPEAVKIAITEYFEEVFMMPAEGRSAYIAKHTPWELEVPDEIAADKVD